MLSNLAVSVAGTLPPLETDSTESDGPTKKSNHRIAFIQSEEQKVVPYKMMKYSYRYYNSESEATYGRWLAQKDWGPLIALESSNAKANLYQAEVVGALEKFFPLVTVKRKSTDPPWYNWKVRKRLAQRRGIYHREGQSAK